MGENLADSWDSCTMTRPSDKLPRGGILKGDVKNCYET